MIGQRAGVLLRLVVERLFLDLAALVHRLHRAEHAAALGQAIELGEHGLLDESVSSSMMKEPCQRVLILCQTRARD
jgi:hypothetical protein